MCIALSKKILSRLALGALAALALVPAALAGTYTVENVVWGSGPTLSGVATATLGTPPYDRLTAYWDINDGVSVAWTSFTRYSSVEAVAKWKVIWHPSSPGETPPSACAATIANNGSEYVQAKIFCDHTMAPFAWYALAETGGTPGYATLSVEEALDRYTEGYPEDHEGSPDSGHLAYTLTTSGWTADGTTGNYYSYITQDISAWTSIQANGGDYVPTMFQVALTGEATTVAQIHGKTRIVLVNGVQVADDFSGGTYATSGYGH